MTRDSSVTTSMLDQVTPRMILYHGGRRFRTRDPGVNRTPAELPILLEVSTPISITIFAAKSRLLRHEHYIMRCRQVRVGDRRHFYDHNAILFVFVVCSWEEPRWEAAQQSFMFIGPPDEPLIAH